MKVFGVEIPIQPLTNFDLKFYGDKLKLKNLKICCRNNLPLISGINEMFIVNFNTSQQTGSHWCCIYKKNSFKIYFDSFGGEILAEVKKFLGANVFRSTDIVQSFGSVICGHLCLYVLKSLKNGKSFRETLNKIPAPTRFKDPKFLPEGYRNLPNKSENLKKRINGSGIKWSSKLANELHKQVRHKFPKRYVFVKSRRQIYGSDIVDMQSLRKKNGGMRYILMVIDIFSKYAYAVPLKNKTGIVVCKALEKVFDKATPKKLWVDRGSEYYNQNVLAMLSERNVRIYSTNNPEKCSVVERLNLTIKRWIFKYFTANSTHKWVDILQPLMNRYNNKRHRSIRMTPTNADKPRNHNLVFKNLFYEKVKKLNKTSTPPKYQVGDRVRLAILKDLFEKSYVISWSDHVYKIRKIFKTKPVVYSVTDLDGTEHKGKFYENDLQIVKAKEFRVEKITEYKTVKGQKYGLVKWIDYDKQTWEPIENLIK